MKLPDRGAFEWSYIFLISYIINFMAIVLTRQLIGAAFDGGAVIGFAIIAFIASSLISLGFFGMRLFSVIFIAADIIAILNMIYVCIANMNDGWTDLTSFFMFIFILTLGFLIALLVQVIKWMRDFKKAEAKVIEVVEPVIEEKITKKKVVKKTSKPKKKTTKKKVTPKKKVKKDS